MTNSWKDNLNDIQDILKQISTSKKSVFSSVYIELSQSCMADMEINPENPDIWKDLDRNFTPCREFHIGTPLARKFNSPNLFRHPDSEALFQQGEESYSFLQWYRKSSENSSPLKEDESSRRIVLPVRAIAKLDDNLQHLIDAAKIVPLPLFQSILGEECTPSLNPLDNWMHLLFMLAWQQKEKTLLRTRDIVYWPCFEEGDEESDESLFSNWISLNEATDIIRTCKKEKIQDKTITDSLGRFFCGSTSNIFSVVEDVFLSSVRLIRILHNYDFESKIQQISDYSEEESLAIIKYARDYAHELPKASYDRIVQHVQKKYPPFRKSHFNRWGPENKYGEILNKEVKEAKKTKFSKLGAD